MKIGILSKLKKMKKRNFILLIGILVVAVTAGALLLKPNSAKAATTKTTVTALKKTSLKDTVSVSGTVKSKTSRNVYTTLNYPVKEIKVSVGDKVKAGDVLATLDTSTLDKDIQSAEYSADSTEKSNQLSLQKAKADYDNAVYLYNNNLNSDLINAKASLASAEQDLKSEKSTYEYDKYLYGAGQLSKKDLDAEQIKLQNAQNTYDKASASLKATQSKIKQDLQSYKITYETTLAKSQDKSQQVTLEKQKQNLTNSTITAPVDGTVTAVNAKVGTNASGTLFQIDDLDNLIVEAEVKEYDVGDVTAGKKVEVKTDATGDKAIAGTVTKVAPAATADTQGTSNVTFTTEVSVTEKNPSIKIGMKARLVIIVNEKSDIYTVPYDAVQQDADGSSYVYEAVRGKDGYTAKKLTVKTGLSNDVNIEVSGDGIKDGVKIVSSPENIREGSTLNLGEAAAAGKSGNTPRGGIMGIMR
jgi:RND family efflux transporter MFP subunit